MAKNIKTPAKNPFTQDHNAAPKKGGRVTAKKDGIPDAASYDKPKLAIGENAVGAVKFFKPAGGWGFIEVPGFADVFVHKTGVPEELERHMEPGTTFNFTVVTSDRDARPMACVTSLAGEMKEAA